MHLCTVYYSMCTWHITYLIIVFSHQSKVTGLFCVDITATQSAFYCLRCGWMRHFRDMTINAIWPLNWIDSFMTQTIRAFGALLCGSFQSFLWNFYLLSWCSRAYLCHAGLWRGLDFTRSLLAQASMFIVHVCVVPYMLQVPCTIFIHTV